MRPQLYCSRGFVLPAYLSLLVAAARVGASSAAGPIPFPTSALWAGDDGDSLGSSSPRVVYRSTAHGNATGACPWDPWRAWLLALHPPRPSGSANEVWLPNDAKPGLELSLTVAGEDDKYPFNVPPGGFGGRQVLCAMPVPARDNNAAMHRLGPVCTLSDPPAMQCQVADAWLDGAPGGPLHDLVAAGARPSSAAAVQAHSLAAPPLPDGGGLPLGGAALTAAVALLDAFRAAQAAVDRAQWQVDLYKAETKASEAAAKALADAAKAAQEFWGDAWGGGGRGGQGRLGTCWEARDVWANATAALAARHTKDRRAGDEKLSAALARRKFRRGQLTTFADGRFPGGHVEALEVDTRDVWGRTPLHWAAAQGQELLAAHTAPGDHVSRAAAGAATPAEWAALVGALLARGAAPNLCDVDGRTPLDLAAAAANGASVRRLLAAGAGRAGSTNRWGATPLDVARALPPSASGDAVRAALGLPR